MYLQIRFSFKVMEYFGKYKKSRKAVELVIIEDELSLLSNGYPLPEWYLLTLSIILCNILVSNHTIRSPIHHCLCKCLLNYLILSCKFLRTTKYGLVYVCKLCASLGRCYLYKLFGRLFWLLSLQLRLPSSRIASTWTGHYLHIAILTLIFFYSLNYPLDVPETIAFSHFYYRSINFSFVLDEIRVLKLGFSKYLSS